MTTDIKELLRRVRHEETCDIQLRSMVHEAVLGVYSHNDTPDYMTNLSHAYALFQQAFPDWFILRLGEFRNPVVYAGDTHTVRADAHMRCACELQHVRGGRLTNNFAPTLPRALVAAMLTVKMREEI